VLYGVAHRIDFVLADFCTFAAALAARSSSRRLVDVVFLSPPWGGPEYLDESPVSVGGTTPEAGSHPEYSLARILPVPGPELFALARRITPNVAFYLPRNASLSDISALLGPGAEYEAGERVEVEEEWMGGKLKALTCYFGGLAQGQEHLFDPPDVAGDSEV